ncbi:MAG: DUF2520 domain-containing protein, partial [Candidatus Acidiferrales bacterium]
IHPLQTITRRSATKLEDVIFALEGDARALRAARRITLALGGDPIVIQARNKPAYHAAAAFAAGQILATMEACTQILMKIGFTRRSAARALIPLVRQKLENFERIGPRNSWTGPLSRGDYATLRKHVNALKRFPIELQDAYRAHLRLAARLLAANPESTLMKIRSIAKSKKGRPR